MMRPRDIEKPVAGHLTAGLLDRPIESLDQLIQRLLPRHFLFRAEGHRIDFVGTLIDPGGRLFAHRQLQPIASKGKHPSVAVAV